MILQQSNCQRWHYAGWVGKPKKKVCHYTAVCCVKDYKDRVTELCRGCYDEMERYREIIMRMPPEENAV